MNARILLIVVAGMLTASILGALLLNFPSMVSAQAQTVEPAMVQARVGTAISYQGRLKEGGIPANGSFDFEFRLFDGATNGAQVGPVESKNSVVVADGLFMVMLDFGDVYTGEARYLEIGVRPGGASSGLTTLSPRQILAPVPYALHSVDASQAISATYAQTAARAMTATHVLNVPPETWRFQNFTISGQPMVSSGISYYSIYGEHLFSSFVPTAVEKRIESIHLIIVERSGSYDHGFTLTFEVRDLDGNIKHTVSAAGIDLKTTPVHVWTEVSLSSVPADLTVSPGEYLAIHVTREGAAGGDLVITPIYEVRVRDSSQ